MAKPGSRYFDKLDRAAWQRLRREIFERDGWRCVGLPGETCGRAGRLELDHIRPMRRGGAPLSRDNLQTLCRDCHRRKSAGESERPDPERDAWREVLRSL